MIVTFWPNLRTPQGERRELSWEQLCATLSEPRPHSGDNHPGWSPGAFSDDRRNSSNVECVWALCLDVDDGMTIEQAESKIREHGWRAHLHTSRKHKPEAHRFRVVVGLSRPVSAFEYGALWARVAPQFGPVDEQAKDASRFWFLPGCPDPETFYAATFDGAPLDVDEWLARPAPRREDPTPQRRPETPVAERARQYIAKMPEAIAGSAGHKATFRVAVVLVRGFELDDDTALAILEQDYNPRCQPVWKRKELAHKVTSARTQGRMPFGEILQRGDDWKPDWGAGYEPAESNDEPDPEPEDVEREAIQNEPNLETKEDDPAAKWRVVFLRDSCSELLDTIGSGKGEQGCTLAHHRLDMLTGGVRSEHVLGFGAGTSWGKSSYGVAVLDDNEKLGHRALIIGLEDAPGMYARRILARRAKLNALRLRDNRCDASEVREAVNTVAVMKNAPFLLPAVGMKGEKLALAIRDLVPALGIKLVIVDYIQRVRLERRTQDRRNEVTMAAELLADAIKTSGAGGIIMSQLIRLPPGQRPTMNNLKETGDLENMCEHVLVGWKEGEDEDAPRKIGVEKVKDGPAGSTVEVNFDLKTASFLTVVDREQQWRDQQAAEMDDLTGVGDGFFDNERPRGGLD